MHPAAPQVVEVSSDGSVNVTVHGGVLRPLAAPPPPPGRQCDKPRLGSLCGAEAVGAIVGIVAGGLLLLGLVIAIAVCLISRVGPGLRRGLAGRASCRPGDP